MRNNRLIVATLPALFSPAFAQSTTTVWSSVVFTYHGEQQPTLSNNLSPSLTSLGASQAINAGAYYRHRYLVTDNTQNATYVGIRGTALNIPNNDQFVVLSTNDGPTINSAQAFLQGLYPPIGTLQVDDLTIMADGTSQQFPLNGYQYIGVDTVGELDWNHIWLAGADECVNYQLSTNSYTQSTPFKALKSGSDAFYASLQNQVFSPLGLSSASLTYTNAYALYEYAAYQYNHNATVRSLLPASSLTTLRLLASQQQFALNGNLSESGANDGDQIRAIAGKTLAYKVLNYLNSAITSKGRSNKLNLMFGSFEPFLSFFSLGGLSSRALLQSGSLQFQSLPLPGSTLVFELFSVTPASQNLTATGMPNANNMWVRFMFRNGTDGTSPLVSYPLFGRGNSENDMTWNEFVAGMQGISVQGIAEWCTTCGDSPFFCSLFVGNNAGSSGSASGSSSATSSGTLNGSSRIGLSPSIAGVIGAAITVLVLLLVTLVATLVGGVRFTRREPSAGATGRRFSSWGGFKGREKMKSDMDVNIAKSDLDDGGTIIRHERVGSWELGDSPTSPTGGMQSKTFGDHGSGANETSVSTADYSKRWDEGDTDSVFDHSVQPVAVHERV